MAEDWNDDPLLRDLPTLAREEEAREAALLDERWDRLAQGELSPEEVERLTAQATAEAGPAEAVRRYEAFRPLEAPFRAQVAARILEELAGRPAEGAETLPAPGRPAAPPPPLSPPSPRSLRAEPPPPRLGAGRLRWRLLAAAAALAGAALLTPRLRVPPFPAYELALLSTGEATERSLAAVPPGTPLGVLPEAAVETPALFHPGTAFEVAVRPLSGIEDLHGTLEVRCLLQDGERLRPWPSCAERAEIAPTQAVRIAGTLGGDLTLEPGSWTLWIVLGRQGRIADLEHRPALLQGEVVAKRNWIALRVPRPLRMEPLP